MPRVRSPRLHRGLACAALALTCACERGPAAPEPALEPVGAPTPAPPVEPAPASPTEPAPEPAAPPEPQLQLPEIEGLAYLEVVTGDADPEAELPMIVAFHGNTAYPGLMAWALLEDTGPASAPAPPFTAPARFIFPRGVEPYGAPGHARWWEITASGAQTDPEQLAALVQAMNEVGERVGASISALVEARPTRGKPIITGHSQGGILTFGLALQHPDRYAAALPAAGWLPEPLWPKQPASGAAKQLPIVSFHGDADTVVSYVETQRSVEALAKLGYDIGTHSYPDVGHSFGPLLADLRAELERRLPE